MSFGWRIQCSWTQEYKVSGLSEGLIPDHTFRQLDATSPGATLLTHPFIYLPPSLSPFHCDRLSVALVVISQSAFSGEGVRVKLSRSVGMSSL